MLSRAARASVPIRARFAHIRFPDGEGGAVADDIVKFEVYKFGKTRKMKNKDKVYPWVFRRDDLDE